MDKTAGLDALLINPVSARTIPAFVPHGLLYIAAYCLQSGYSVAVYDRNVDSLDIDKVLTLRRPKVVGLGCLTGKAIDDAIYVSKRVREFDPAIKIVWGGIHTTLYPDSVLKQDYVDYVVLGDGEYAFTKVISHAVRGTAALEAIDNLGYKSAGEMKYNPRSFVEMANLPQPAWHLIAVEKYIRRKFYAKRVLTINTSRGCPYKCSFCCVPAVHLGKWRAVSAKQIAENLSHLKDKYHIDGFQVDDDEFDIDRKRVLELCDLFEKNKAGLKWSHFSRINIVKEEVLRKEVGCGLRLIEFGAESGSERMLKFLNKGQTVTMIKEAYSVCRKLGLKTSALFMIGLPTETQQEVQETVKLIKGLNPYLTICTVYRPYPGSELFDYCVDNRLFRYPDKLEEVARTYEEVINTSAIPDETINRIKRHFDRNNIYQELKFILSRMKFGLLFYYLFYYVLGAKRRGLSKNDD